LEKVWHVDTEVRVQTAEVGFGEDRDANPTYPSLVSTLAISALYISTLWLATLWIVTLSRDDDARERHDTRRQNQP
jgi:hypothetical protein